MNGMSNGSLLLEEKVLNAVKRMRCSRRSGVIFLAMITAIAWPTPHHRRRRSLSSRRSLLVSASANYRHPPCLIITPNHAPVAANSAAGREGWRSQTEGEIFKGTDGACADPGTRIFPATGWPGPLPVLFNRLLRLQRSLLWYFLGLQESTVLPPSRPSVVPSFLPPAELAMF